MDTENKQLWCDYGLSLEYKFVDEICPKLGLSAIINPAKLSDKYAPDLIVNGNLADLKHQSIPFFTSQIKWGIDPMYAVSFNYKDYVRYSSNYPHILIFFWIERIPREEWYKKWKWIGDAYNGVFVQSFQFIKALIDAKPILHIYQKRVNDDTGNAKDSYIFDVRKLTFLHTIGD